MLVYEIRHSLCWRSLLHISSLPAVAFHLFLKMHHPQSVLTLNIFRSHLNDHTAVCPLSTAVARAHAVDNNLLWSCCRRNNKTARTHTKTIHPSSVNLGDEIILGGRQIFSPSVRVMVLNLINQLLRMFKSYTYSQPFSLNFHLIVIEPLVNIPCRMSCGKNDRTFEYLFRAAYTINSFDTSYLAIINDKRSHLCLEMHFTSTFYNSVAHVLNDLW